MRRTLRDCRRARALRLRGLCLALIAIAGLGCGGRERTNPFDPANPDHGGTPPALDTAAACRRVDLRWTDLAMVDRLGYRVGRSGPSEAETLLTAAPLDPSKVAWTDTSAANGVPYRYRIEFLFEGASGFTAPAPARPGASLAWCADPCGWGLALLTPDARAQRALLQEGRAIYDLAVDAAGHRLFAAAPDDPGALIVLATDGAGDAREIALAGATCVGWSAAAGALAAGAFLESRVTWLDDAGEVLQTLGTAGTPRRFPEDLAFRDSSCTWIALSDASRTNGLLLRARLGSATADTTAAALGRPTAVADDPGLGCWVADRTGAVVYVTDALVATASAPGELEEPTDVAADGAGLCWVADRGARALVLVDRDCAVRRRIEGLAGLLGVTVDPISGTLWATVPEDGKVIALDVGTGERIGAVELPGCPVKVEGDWTGGCPDERATR
jgi:hypothetical protein